MSRQDGGDAAWLNDPGPREITKEQMWHRWVRWGRDSSMFADPVERAEYEAFAKANPAKDPLPKTK